MSRTKLNISAALLVAIVAATADRVLAQPLPPKPAHPVAVEQARSKPVDSAAVTQTEAKVAQIRDLVKPQPGEHVTNMARINWEHDPWEAAVKAARQGKPILAWGECGAGVPCGYG